MSIGLQGVSLGWPWLKAMDGVRSVWHSIVHREKTGSSGLCGVIGLDCRSRTCDKREVAVVIVPLTSVRSVADLRALLAGLHDCKFG